MRAIVAILLALAPCADAVNHYYLPGVTPNAWNDGDSVTLKTNHVTSTHSPIQYDYYDLPFCKKSKRTKAKSDNIGETLSGDSVTESPYEVSPASSLDMATPHSTRLSLSLSLSLCPSPCSLK